MKGTTVTITTGTTSTTGTTDYTELRDKQQKVWSSGDYNRIAHITVPVSEHLVDQAGVMPGSHVLDVATGTGHVALAAARRGAVVQGMDYVPELLDIARRRADAEDLDIEYVEADAENLPYGDGSFDFVFSAIGVMFAADHARAASELVRVTRKGGRIAIASWTPEGFVGGMLAAVGRHVSPPPGAQPATRWGSEAVVAELLGEGVEDVSSVTATVRQNFRTPEEFADLFLTYYGPTYAAANRLDEEGRAAFRADLVALAKAFDQSTGEGVVCNWEYRIVTATKR
jgi:ubiquinone/menaquinone biosynthesis C-methylase UbiE